MFFAYSSKDACLALLSVLNLTVILWPFVQYDVLSPSALFTFACLGVVLNCTKYQCIAHNFWTALVCFYVPAWYLGQVSAYAENYLEHYGADPYNKLKDSASCYGKLHNLIWFNNGYHQEHHLRPAMHWSRIKEVKLDMLPVEERRVVPIAHWCDFAWISGELRPLMTRDAYTRKTETLEKAPSAIGRREQISAHSTLVGISRDHHDCHACV
jgi:hypothetical protein